MTSDELRSEVLEYGADCAEAVASGHGLMPDQSEWRVLAEFDKLAAERDRLRAALERIRDACYVLDRREMVDIAEDALRCPP